MRESEESGKGLHREGRGKREEEEKGGSNEGTRKGRRQEVKSTKGKAEAVRERSMSKNIVVKIL